ncbi:hypothetical protein [Streptomyces sp. NPDC018833]|uniref:hypothetical protein n=1 Tax=Streptomyces sp. NPDC018833 TaxID=3365053 RepID=UPI00379A4E46
MSTSRDPHGVGANRVNDINDDQLRVTRTLLLIGRPADAPRGPWQSEEVRPAAAARERLSRAGAEHPNAPVRRLRPRRPGADRPLVPPVPVFRVRPRQGHDRDLTRPLPSMCLVPLPSRNPQPAGTAVKARADA